MHQVARLIGITHWIEIEIELAYDFIIGRDAIANICSTVIS